MSPIVQKLLALTLCSGALLFDDSCALLHCHSKQLIASTSRGHRLSLTTSAGNDETNEKKVGGGISNTDKRVGSLESKKSSLIGEPQIFSKQALFGNGYNAVTISAVDEEFSAASIRQKNLPKGIERLQPSTLVKKTSINNDGDNETESDEYEIVDKFRFKIDADTLRNAISQKQSLKARQELLSTAGSDVVSLSKQEVLFDAAFLDKLTSSGTLDESGDSTVLRVQLDYDEFESMIQTATPLAEQKEEEGEGNKSTPTFDGDDNAALFSSNPVFFGRQTRRDRKDSLQYSSSRMDEAEAFLAQSSSSSSFQSMSDDGWKDRDDSKQAYSSYQAKMEKLSFPLPARLSSQNNNYNSTLLLESLTQPTTSRKGGIFSILGWAGDLLIPFLISTYFLLTSSNPTFLLSMLLLLLLLPSTSWLVSEVHDGCRDDCHAAATRRTLLDRCDTTSSR